MKRKAAEWSWVALAFVLWGSVAVAHVAEPALFGVALRTATRVEIGQALRAAHMTLSVNGAHKWYDLYNVNGALKNASVLAVSFTEHGHFAKAMYVFPSFVSTKRFAQVVKEVRAKYGAPTRKTGQQSIGPVRAVWILPHAFDIVVKRRWPNPTTFMVIENRVNLRRMKQQQKRFIAHSGAF